MLPGNTSNAWRGRASEGTQRHTLGISEETRGNVFGPAAAVGADFEMANYRDEAVVRDSEIQAENRSSGYVFSADAEADR